MNLLVEPSRSGKASDVDQRNLCTVMLINRLDHLVRNNGLTERCGVNTVRRKEIAICCSIHQGSVIRPVPALMYALIQIKEIDYREILFCRILSDFNIVWMRIRIESFSFVYYFEIFEVDSNSPPRLKFSKR